MAVGVSLVGVYLLRSLSTPSVSEECDPLPRGNSLEVRRYALRAAPDISDPPSTRIACAIRTCGLGGVGGFTKQTPRCHWTLRGRTATKVSGARLRHRAFIFLPFVRDRGSLLDADPVSGSFRVCRRRSSDVTGAILSGCRRGLTSQFKGHPRR